MQARPETLAYMALINPTRQGKPDAIGVVDLDPASKSYGRLVGQTDMPNTGDELHHFGWNACSACLCPYAPHPHMERRYLIVPGINSSRIHILDTKPDPRQPKIVKVIEPEELANRAGYASPHTIHCGPDGIYVSALGAPGGDGPGGTFVKDLSSSIWLWYRDKKASSNGNPGPWAVKKIIEIPAEPADPETLPPLLQGFKAVAPLVTDINLSLDDKYLYVSCWGTGEFIQYNVTDPFNPKKVSSVRLGGIISRAAHPAAPDQPLNGGPQMVEISRDGKRVYFTNGLYTPWDEQFYPDGVRGWVAKLDVGANGMTIDKKFFLQTDGMRTHQLRLEGGDASSDSYCYA